jgi:hypothetical protein
MATGRDRDSTHLIKRDLRQDHGGGPEEMKGHPKRKRDKRWCKGKEGREHRWEHKVIYSWTNSSGQTFEQKRWVCLGCGKHEYTKPKQPPVIPSHKHDYSDTKIESNWWDNRQKLWEVCMICGREGKYIYVD